MIRFARSQKVYKYKYYDEWRYHKWMMKFENTS
jgi:hypothetical protein